MIEKITKLANHWSTIYAAMAAFFYAGYVLADTKFQTDDEANKRQIIMLEYDIQMLQADLGASENDRERQKYETKIRIRESQIRQLKEGL